MNLKSASILFSLLLLPALSLAGNLPVYQGIDSIESADAAINDLAGKVLPSAGGDDVFSIDRKNNNVLIGSATVSYATISTVTVTSATITNLSVSTITWTGMTRSTESRVVAHTGNGHGSTGTRIRRFTTIATIGTDITVADNSVTGTTFTIVNAGEYAMTYSDLRAGSAANIGITINANSLTATNVDTVTVAQGRISLVTTPTGGFGQCSATRFLSAGDIVRAHTNATADTTGDGCYFEITRVR